MRDKSNKKSALRRREGRPRGTDTQHTMAGKVIIIYIETEEEHL